MAQDTEGVSNGKGEVQYNETLTASPPSEPNATGEETTITWKTWIVIFVSFAVVKTSRTRPTNSRSYHHASVYPSGRSLRHQLCKLASLFCLVILRALLRIGTFQPTRLDVPLDFSSQEQIA